MFNANDADDMEFNFIRVDHKGITVSLVQHKILDDKKLQYFQRWKLWFTMMEVLTV